MKHRDFVCADAGDVNFVLNNDEKINMEIQKALLVSLKKRNLITHQQMLDCVDYLEKQLNSHIQHSCSFDKFDV